MAQEAEDPRLALYQEYLKVPAHQRSEIIRGTLYVTPRPSPPHANATSVLSVESSAGHFSAGGADLADGGFWTSPSYSW